MGIPSIGGYAWALACDHIEVVHCHGNHMNLMTPDRDGGDLMETIVPHLSRELAQTWDENMRCGASTSTSTCTQSLTLSRVISLQVSTRQNNSSDNFGDGQHFGQPALGDTILEAAHRVLRSSGELRDIYSGIAWTIQRWHPTHDLPLWTRRSEESHRLSEFFTSCIFYHNIPRNELRQVAYAHLLGPALDSRFGGVALGLNRLAWSLSRGKPYDDAAPHTAMILVQDLMERTDEWSPIVLTAEIPTLGVHLPSNIMSGGICASDGDENFLLHDAHISRISAVVLATALGATAVRSHEVRDTVLSESLGFETRMEDALAPGDSWRHPIELVFAALPGEQYERVATACAMQCQLLGHSNACAVTLHQRGHDYNLNQCPSPVATPAHIAFQAVATKLSETDATWMHDLCVAASSFELHATSTRSDPVKLAIEVAASRRPRDKTKTDWKEDIVKSVESNAKLMSHVATRVDAFLESAHVTANDRRSDRETHSKGQH